MVLWFYFLWSVTVIHVLTGPLLRITSKILWGVVVIAGVWLSIGALTYQARYTAFLIEKQRLIADKQVIARKKERVDSLSASHPTSIPLRVRQAILSLQLGDIDQAKKIFSELKKIHPSAPQVVELEKHLQ